MILLLTCVFPSLKIETWGTRLPGDGLEDAEADEEGEAERKDDGPGIEGQDGSLLRHGRCSLRSAGGAGLRDGSRVRG